MTAVRLVRSVTEPSLHARQPIAALIAVHRGVVLVRAPSRHRPAAARAKVERVLRDLEGAVPLDPLPLGAGAQVVGDAVLAAPVPPVRRPPGRAAPSPTGRPEMRAPVHLARCARLRPSTRERAVAGRRAPAEADLPQLHLFAQDARP